MYNIVRGVLVADGAEGASSRGREKALLGIEAEPLVPVRLENLQKQ